MLQNGIFASKIASTITSNTVLDAAFSFVYAKRKDKTHNDDIKKVLSYEEIINVINNVTKQNHKYLAETVAEEIARRCLKYKDSISAHVTLKKPDIIKGKTVVGVEIYLEN